MRFLTKIIFFLSGISVIGLMLWFGMPNIQQAFKPVEIISVTITLNNKCSVDNDSFADAVPGTVTTKLSLSTEHLLFKVIVTEITSTGFKAF